MKTVPSTHSTLKRKWCDPIQKEQLWKSEVCFIENQLWQDLLTWWKCKRLYMVIRGATSVLTRSVCMVSGPAWASRALLDLAAGQPDALCPHPALLSPVKRKLAGLLNRMETYAGITWPCSLLRPALQRLHTCGWMFWIRFESLLQEFVGWTSLVFKARFEPVSRARGLTRLPLLFSEIKAQSCHNRFQQPLSWHVLLYGITQ